MKKIIFFTLILFTSLHCSAYNKQKAEPLDIQHKVADSAVIKNNQAVHIYMNAKGNTDSLEKAIELLDEALVINPMYSTAYANKAQYLNIMGRNKEVMDVIDKALENLPQDPQLYFVKGILYEKEGLSELAERCFLQSVSNYDKLIRANPDDFNLVLNKAFVCVFTKNEENSLKELKSLKSRYRSRKV